MNTRNIILSALGLVALAIAAAPVQQAYAQKAVPSVAKWEYKVVQVPIGGVVLPNGDTSDLGGEIEKVSNKQGMDGWELCQSSEGTWNFEQQQLPGLPFKPAITQVITLLTFKRAKR